MTSDVMRGDITDEERMARRMARMSNRQRILVLTFDSTEEARRWDSLPGEERLQHLLVTESTDD
jgi:monoamine oxidase